MDEQCVPQFQMQPIGYVESCFAEKFGTPRQANLVNAAYGRICMVPPFDTLDAFDGIQACSHVWIQFVFHGNRDERFRPKIRPPRLGGNATMGVFASRSPYRPNALGLSAVKLESLRREGGRLYLHYSGGDMISGSPVLDIKPYLPYADCVTSAYYPPAEDGNQEIAIRFSTQAEQACLNLHARGFKKLIEEVLRQDPRPRFQFAQTGRQYVMQLDEWDIAWVVRSAERSKAEFFVTQITQSIDNIKP